MNVELNEKSDWIKIRSELNQTYKYDQTWGEAIQLFDKRLKRKYLKPVKVIIDQKILEGEGFTIVTVLCALIEMLAAFRQGKIFNYNKTADSPEYEYKHSQKMFTSLLRTASIFQDNFWQLNNKGKVVIDKPYNSVEFYDNVRCGLMHEARTKGNWHITATPLKKTVKTENIFLTTEDGKIKIYRTILYYRLVNYIQEFEDELRDTTPESDLLRKYFARKLDHLFDYCADKSFDWWT